MNDATPSALSGWQASVCLGRLAFKQLMRGRAKYISLVGACLPAIYAAFAIEDHFRGAGAWGEVFHVSLALLALIPPLHLAPAVAEEIEEKTFTYLWSRPLPRWSLLTGKLLALVPTLAVLLAAAIAAAFPSAYGAQAGQNGDVLLRGVGALTAGVLAAGCVCVGLGTLVHKHAMATSIAYLLLLDLPIGETDFSLSNLSLSHHVIQIAQVEQSPGATGTALVWLAGLATFWLAIAFWRIGRAEFATDK